MASPRHHFLIGEAVRRALRQARLVASLAEPIAKSSRREGFPRRRGQDGSVVALIVAAPRQSATTWAFGRLRIAIPTGAKASQARHLRGRHGRRSRRRNNSGDAFGSRSGHGAPWPPSSSARPAARQYGAGGPLDGTRFNSPTDFVIENLQQIVAGPRASGILLRRRRYLIVLDLEVVSRIRHRLVGLHVDSKLKTGLRNLCPELADLGTVERRGNQVLANVDLKDNR